MSIIPLKVGESTTCVSMKTTESEPDAIFIRGLVHAKMIFVERPMKNPNPPDSFVSFLCPGWANPPTHVEYEGLSRQTSPLLSDVTERSSLFRDTKHRLPKMGVSTYEFLYVFRRNVNLLMLGVDSLNLR